jgi:hypothetical protein
VEKLLAAPEQHHTRIQGSKLWHLALLEFWLQMHLDRMHLDRMHLDPLRRTRVAPAPEGGPGGICWKPPMLTPFQQAQCCNDCAGPPSSWWAWPSCCPSSTASRRRPSPATCKAAFEIHSAALGGLAATYFYVYTVMQIPTGVLADTLGPRRIVVAGGVVAGLGSCCSAWPTASSWPPLGRLLVGLGVSVTFIACSN